MNIGTLIQSYVIIASANGYVMGRSSTAPSPYAVWQIDNDSSGVCCGHYFADREEAEWDFCARAFEWFEDNVNIHMIEDENCEEDQCEKCRYNTNDYVCHPHCSGCDGKSKFVSKKPLERRLIDGLKDLRTSLAAVTRLVDEMCAEVDRLRSGRRTFNDHNINQRL